jgi:hypothetical protein
LIPPQTWTEIIPPQEWAWISKKVRRLEKLIREIDLGYETGRFGGIEEKEVEAERLEEELSALHDFYIESPGEVGEGHSVDEFLISTYLMPERFVDRAGWIENMRESIRMSVTPYDPDVRIPDRDVLEIAKEAVLRRRELIARYRKPKKEKLSGARRLADCSYLCPAAGYHDFQAWGQGGETADQACRRRLALRIDAAQVPLCEKQRARWVD